MLEGSRTLSERQSSPDAAPVRVAVVGCGYFGNLHAQKYAALESADLVAVLDTNSSRAEKTAAEHNTKAVTDLDELLVQVDAVSIVSPTTTHHSIAKRCLEAGRDVLVEKPICETLEEADDLIAAAKESGRILQVGHLERFSPLIKDVNTLVERPAYIESHRISQYRGRGTDTTVILDMMVHDIDNIMMLVGCPIERIDAVGVPVISEAEDIANARIQFRNGCVATVTASRVSWKIQRTMRVFQHNAYVVADMVKNKLIVMNRTKSCNGTPTVGAEQRQYDQADLIMMECADFVDCVRTLRKPVVSGESVRDVMAAALSITEQLRKWRRELD